MLFYLTMSTEEAVSLPLHPSPALRRHIAAIQSEAHARESRAAYALLERLCLLHTCIFPHLAMPPLATLDFLPSGKPILPSGVYVSLSHSGNAVAAAVADAPVGIDVERVSPSPRILPLAARFFPASDAARVEEAQKSEGDTAAAREFFRLFTAKEAYLKCKDTTFPTAMKVAYPPLGCTLTEETVALAGEGYALAICVKE